MTTYTATCTCGLTTKVCKTENGAYRSLITLHAHKYGFTNGTSASPDCVSRYTVTAAPEYDAFNYCTICDEHIADPHQPTCPRY